MLVTNADAPPIPGALLEEVLPAAIVVASRGTRYLVGLQVTSSAVGVADLLSELSSLLGLS